MQVFLICPKDTPQIRLLFYWRDWCHFNSVYSLLHYLKNQKTKLNSELFILGLSQPRKADVKTRTNLHLNSFVRSVFSLTLTETFLATSYCIALICDDKLPFQNKTGLKRLKIWTRLLRRQFKAMWTKNRSGDAVVIIVTQLYPKVRILFKLWSSPGFLDKSYLITSL